LPFVLSCFECISLDGTAQNAAAAVERGDYVEVRSIKIASDATRTVIGR